jgi:hypothetical protein
MALSGPFSEFVTDFPGTLQGVRVIDTDISGTKTAGALGAPAKGVSLAAHFTGSPPKSLTHLVHELAGRRFCAFLQLVQCAGLWLDRLTRLVRSQEF